MGDPGRSHGTASNRPVRRSAFAGGFPSREWGGAGILCATMLGEDAPT